MKGCICPPTAEQTCKAYDCPRKTAAPDVQPLDVPSYNAGVADMRRELNLRIAFDGYTDVQSAADRLTKPLK